MYHRVYAFPARYCVIAFGSVVDLDREDPGLFGFSCLVDGCGSEYSWWKRGGEESGWAGSLSPFCVLYGFGMLVLHQLNRVERRDQETREEYC